MNQDNINFNDVTKKEFEGKTLKERDLIGLLEIIKKYDSNHVKAIFDIILKNFKQNL